MFNIKQAEHTNTNTPEAPNLRPNPRQAKQRIEEAGFELDHLIHEGKLDSVPIAVLFNKTDLETAMETRELQQKIEYTTLVQSHNGKMECFRISVLEQKGYQEAFRWISNLIWLLLVVITV